MQRECFEHKKFDQTRIKSEDYYVLNGVSQKDTLGVHLEWKGLDSEDDMAQRSFPKVRRKLCVTFGGNQGQQNLRGLLLLKLPGHPSRPPALSQSRRLYDKVNTEMPLSSLLGGTAHEQQLPRWEDGGGRTKKKDPFGSRESPEKEEGLSGLQRHPGKTGAFAKEGGLMG